MPWSRVYYVIDGEGVFRCGGKTVKIEPNHVYFAPCGAKYGFEGMPKLEKLNALVGSYINLEYRLPNGRTVKYLDDNATYLGNQLECEFGGDRCFGIAANMEFILVCTYEKDGENPELILYKKR
jgi:hypothetical protein